jgi:subtilisin family serine protease
MLGTNRNVVVALEGFGSAFASPDLGATTVVVSAEVETSQIESLEKKRGVTVWANTAIELVEGCECCSGDLGLASGNLFDLASSAGGLDCQPFQPAVTIEAIRTLLGVDRVWRDGFRGQNIVVCIIDEGVNGMRYPVVGGFSRPNAQRPGTADITSHGSMCAADVLVAAPAAKLYDYPFLGILNSGGALEMFQAALTQRRSDGTPHVLNNSWGFVAVPPQEDAPNHEIWAIDHPLHRKVREVVSSGATVLFAAGNCGVDCPSANCRPSGIGPGKSIHGSSSLAEVITVAAVNSHHQRIGYSSQGPGMFEAAKPDVASYSHFFGNFGPGRPGGETHSPFDNGTSCATPVASGVAALLLSAFPGLSPRRNPQGVDRRRNQHRTARV